MIEPIPCKDGLSAKSSAFTSALVVVETAHTVAAKAFEKKKKPCDELVFLSVSELIVSIIIITPVYLGNK